MPFVPKENRRNMDGGGCPQSVGDLCYVEYKKLMTAWKKARRWTTVHNEFKRVFGVDDEQAAKTLAFLVFMSKKVMDYENEKCDQNGNIDGN